MDQRIDHRHSLEHFQQSNMIALALVALVLNVPLMLLCLAFGVLLGGVQPQLSPFRWLYSKLTGIQLEPNQGFDASQFAQLMGGSLLLLSSLLLFAGYTTLAVALTGTVMGFALLNLTTGYCVACQLFYHFKRQQHQHSQRHPHH